MKTDLIEISPLSVMLGISYIKKRFFPPILNALHNCDLRNILIESIQNFTLSIFQLSGPFIPFEF